MKILFLFSGSLRTFEENINTLEQIINKINIDYDLYMYNSDDAETIYNNVNTSIKLSMIEKTKVLVNDKIIKINLEKYKNIYNISEIKIINTIKQWYKLKVLFDYVKKEDYDIIVRIRPDINIVDISENIENLSNILKNIKKDNIYIPLKNDIYDNKIFDKLGKYNSINDQFAMGDYETMKIYSNFYNYLEKYSEIMNRLFDIYLKIKGFVDTNKQIQKNDLYSFIQ